MPDLNDEWQPMWADPDAPRYDWPVYPEGYDCTDFQQRVLRELSR